MRRSVAIVLASCSPSSGQVAVDAALVDAPVTEASTVYHGTLDQTAPVMFGGGTYCTYSITLTSLAIDVTVRPTGDVSAAAVQNLNVEGIVGACPYTPSPPTIATYMLASAKPIPNGTALELAGDPANTPKVTLTIDMLAAGVDQAVTATFHRTDQAAVLNWTVTAQLTLAAP
ncbi:MAG: hypothetical protein ABI591_03285 [Kofleriaceae bacterium]